MSFYTEVSSEIKAIGSLFLNAYLVVVFCFGDISADDDEPKAGKPSSPTMQGEPVSIEEASGDT